MEGCWVEAVGGLPAVRGGFQSDTAGFSHLQRGGVHLYGGLCWAANYPRKVNSETRSTEPRMLYFNHVDGLANMCWRSSLFPIQLQVVIRVYMSWSIVERLIRLYRNSSTSYSLFIGEFQEKINITLVFVLLNIKLHHKDYKRANG